MTIDANSANSIVSALSSSTRTSTASNSDLTDSALAARFVSDKISLKSSPLFTGSFLSSQGLLHGKIDISSYIYTSIKICGANPTVPLWEDCSFNVVFLINLVCSFAKTFVLGSTIKWWIYIFSGVTSTWWNAPVVKRRYYKLIKIGWTSWGATPIWNRRGC